jgi:hypothetical protein
MAGCWQRVLDSGEHSGRGECEEAVRRGVGAAGEWEVDARAGVGRRAGAAVGPKGHDQGCAHDGAARSRRRCVEAARAAAVVAMLAVAAQSPSGAVIESNFYRSRAVGELGRLPGQVVEVFCRIDRDVARLRYQTRAGSRHAGHFDSIRSDEELWNAEVSEPVAGGWPLLEIDTTEPTDVPEIVRRIRDMTP